MRLNEKEKAALRGHIERMLDHASVKYGSFITARAESILSDHPDGYVSMCRKVEQAFSGTSIFHLIRSFFFEQLAPTNPEVGELRLSDALARPADEIVSKILEDVQAGPRKYMFVFPFRDDWGMDVAQNLVLPIKGATATIADSSLLERLPIRSPNAFKDSMLFRYGGAADLLTGTTDRSDFVRDKYGICAFGDGWYGQYCDDLFDEASDRIGAVYGLMEAFDVIVWEPSSGIGPTFALSYKMPQVELVGTPHRRNDLLEFEKFFKPRKDWQSDEKRKEAFDRFGRAFQLVFGQKEGQPIETALYWYFRSKLGRSKQEQVIDLSVCLEILAGVRKDKDDPSIGSLISTRVSYSIAQSYVEREGLLGYLNSFYGVRSAVVHSGKRRFTNEEDTSVFAASEACKRLIVHEVRLLAANTDYPLV